MIRALLCAIWLTAFPAVVDGRPPNFVVILTDDHGYHDLGCFGSTKIKTPNVDRLAAEGMRFTSFYAQAVCGPSRAALMTGCYPIRVAEPGNQKHQHTVLHPREVTLAEVLKPAGYATACIGKWHLGLRRGGEWDLATMPNRQGFDYFYGTPLYNGFTVQVGDTKFRSSLWENEKIVLESVESWDGITRDYTERAIHFIRDHAEEPFFLYLAHNMPHIPLGASEAFRGKSEYGPYGDAVEETDWSTGRIMAAIEELGLDQDTLLVFTSDNGPWIETTHGNAPDAKPFIPREHSGTADPLRGYKMLTWEGGLRVPCVMRWPDRIPAATTCDEVAATIDLLPTLARLADAALPSDRILDGKDIWPLMSGQPEATSPHAAFCYYCFTHLQAVRSGKWKLVLPRPEHPAWVGFSGRFCGNGVNAPELYDLDADIGEARDVASQHADVVRSMMQLLEEARADLGDYDRIGAGARFFDEGPRRQESRRWLGEGSAAQGQDGGGRYPRDFTYRVAIGHEPGVTRRDPSDVIRADGKYYVWYSKVAKGPGVWEYPSGYSADVWYATSPDGRQWTEQREAIGKGGEGAWDEHGVFTPNILAAQGKYYLFYTGVARGHGRETPTRIGIAVGESPDGPWKKFEQNPVLIPSEDPAAFDSMRVDDAALLVRGGKFWLYYKGRQQAHSPGETKMGVAIAQSPTGPYVKHGGPLHPGHEVMVWPHDEGVASLATAAGPRQVYFACDGLDFQPRNPVAHPPQAPGAFRFDHSQDVPVAEGLKWGIGHTSRQGDLYLSRFDCRWTGPVSAPDRLDSVEYEHPDPVGNLRFDFETGELQGWRVVEGEFQALINDRSHFHHTLGAARYNKQGKFFLTTLERAGGGRGNDAQTGVVESPVFRLEGEEASFLIGGGRHANTYVALADANNGEELLTARGDNTEIMKRVRWNTSDYRGRRVCLRVVDQNTGSWGHVTFDDFSCQAAIEASDGP